MLSLTRELDLGAVIVGKQKTSQFASGADPWEWTDVQPPFNPRGDGYLTCSASSAGGACAVAAYDWLDYSIGTDTGQSVRRPAAVAGVFGNRPSQGLMSTDGVMPISFATDTLGVFSRDPVRWAYFAEKWYTPSLYQNRSATGLPMLQEYPYGSDHVDIPSRILYTTDYLPMQNPKAEALLQGVIQNLKHHFNMSVEPFSFSVSIDSLSVPGVQNLTTYLDQLAVLWEYDQLVAFADPFLEKYAAKFNGSYPPLDRPNRESFRAPAPTASRHSNALAARANFTQAWQDHVFGRQTEQKCSDSIVIYDIGGGGVPSFREHNLNLDQGSRFLAASGLGKMGGDMCSFVGCADFTVPIGQVPYYSNTTFEEVYVPVTVSMVVRRGCDAVLFGLVKKMAGLGMLNGVKAGKDAF